VARDRIADAIAQAGGARKAVAVPDPLPLSLLREWTEREEALLRAQFPDGLPDEWEAELSSHDSSTGSGALRRYVAVKRLFHDQFRHESQRDDAAEQAARQIMRREPVRVELGGAEREVRGRSYAAYQELAQHQLAIDLLRGQIDDLQAEYAGLVTVHDAVASLEFRRRREIRGAMQDIIDALARARSEVLRHRERIYAHACRPDAGPAPADEQAPEWWLDATEADDARLIVALWEAGQGRYRQLGPAPKAKSKGAKRLEEMGFASLFASIEKDRGLEPASLYDRDLFQALTAARAGAVDFSRDD